MYTRVDKFKTTESPVAVWQQDIKYRKWYNILHLFSQQATSLAGLATSRYLEELNLASNQISSFREILNLSRLAALRSLSLSDPHFGDNPICKLCNYQTHVTFHLNQLNSLDMEAISENAKRLSKAIYLKKKMYYNMRMKTLKRYATNVVKRGEELYGCTIDPTIQSLGSLMRSQKVFRGMWLKQRMFNSGIH
mmetsp:Transcript_8391/g.28762  ORF Transcript_8391/g.28762 Transcript_8391/m.28762 type:complete len:193 (+) Transcript_8391:1236-1814(+)